MNKCIFTGRLTRDVELRTTNNNNSIAMFSIAVDQGYGNNKQTYFFDMTAFGKNAETLSKYCRKGSKILVEATAVQDRYTNKNGEKVNKIKFICDNFEFFEPKRNPCDENDYHSYNS